MLTLLPDFIMTCLESSRQEIPTMDEVKANLLVEHDYGLPDSHTKRSVTIRAHNDISAVCLTDSTTVHSMIVKVGVALAFLHL